MISGDNSPVNLPVNLPVKLSKLDQSIVSMMKENDRITYDLLAQQLSRTRETIRVHISSLISQGIITRIGADKNGYWQVN